MDDFLKNAWDIALTGLMFLGGFVWNRAVKRLDDIEEKQTTLNDEHKECKLDLANFKFEASNTYAKEATMQASLGRVHECMETGFKEIRADIKLLIGGSKK